MTGEKYKSEALEKGLDILELLAQDRSGLTKAEIASALGRSVGQIFRMLASLETRGYVRSVNNCFFLTLKLNELLVRESSVTRMLTSAREEMQQFSMKTEQPCHLCIYQQGRLVVVHQIDPPTNIGVNIKIGATVDIGTSGSGLALLAFSSDQMVESICSDANINKEWFSMNQNALERTKRTGIVSEPSKDLVAVTNIAAPVFDRYKTVVAVLTAPYLEFYESSWQRSSSSVQDVKKELLITAKAISNAL